LQWQWVLREPVCGVHCAVKVPVHPVRSAWSPEVTCAALQAETRLNEAEAAERAAAEAYEQTRETMRAELVVFQSDESGAISH
jgi:hypothetical protein